jgi:hypothetical protein
MSTLDIVIVVAVALIVALAVGGMLANARWRQSREARLGASLDEVNRKLAAAHAHDKGWEPEALAAAARRFFAEQQPGEEVRDEALVAVIDKPGTDSDQAMFRFVTGTGTWLLTLGRTDGEWFPVSLEPA